MVGVGIVFNVGYLVVVKVVGVCFVVLLGVLLKLFDVVDDSELLLLFGVVIVSEVMIFIECGYCFLKFFFVVFVGGIKFIGVWVSLLL